MAAALRFRSAQFWKASIGKIDEQNVEAELDDDSGYGRLHVAEVGLPVLLACLCRLVEFGRVGFPDFCQVSVTDYGGLSSACRGSVGIPGK